MASMTIGLTIVLLVIIIFLTVAWFGAYYADCPWELERNIWRLFLIIVVEVILAIWIANEACDSSYCNPCYKRRRSPCHY